MSLHVFANFVTSFGPAANNRGETEGNVTTLQKLIWMGETHSSVSAEAIRFALRRRLADAEKNGTNRTWNEDLRRNEWRSGQNADAEFAKWTDPAYTGFIDDDLLGFMAAEAGKEEAGETDADVADAGAKKDKPGKGKKPKGTATTRRSPLEVTRAISLTPWTGDVTFNAASPMATPSAAKKGTEYSVPYGTEVHATRYQYGIALTPDRLRDKSRTAKAIDALCALGTVAGNHGRFLFDFSPDAIVIRLTSDPAPRFLYCFDTKDDGKTVIAPRLIDRIRDGDIAAEEVILAGVPLIDSNGEPLDSEKAARVSVSPGVMAARAQAIHRINDQLGIRG
jgi:CRISPR-associated protein Cst2